MQQFDGCKKVMTTQQFDGLDIAWKGQYGPPTQLLGVSTSKVVSFWKSHDNETIWQFGHCLKRSIWSSYPAIGGFNLESSKFLKSLPSFMVRMDGMVEIQACSEGQKWWKRAIYQSLTLYNMKGMGTEVTCTIFESPLARVLTTRIEGYFHLNYDATQNVW
jgi:hypothetical protein